MVSRMFYLQPSLGRLTTNQSCDTLYVTWVLLFWNCRCSPPGLQRHGKKWMFGLWFGHIRKQTWQLSMLWKDVSHQQLTLQWEEERMLLNIVFSILFWMILTQLNSIFERSLLNSTPALVENTAPPMTLMSLLFSNSEVSCLFASRFLCENRDWFKKTGHGLHSLFSPGVACHRSVKEWQILRSTARFRGGTDCTRRIDLHSLRGMVQQAAHWSLYQRVEIWVTKVPTNGLVDYPWTNITIGLTNIPVVNDGQYWLVEGWWTSTILQLLLPSVLNLLTHEVGLSS